MTPENATTIEAMSISAANASHFIRSRSISRERRNRTTADATENDTRPEADGDDLIDPAHVRREPLDANRVRDRQGVGEDLPGLERIPGEGPDADRHHEPDHRPPPSG